MMLEYHLDHLKVRTAPEVSACSLPSLSLSHSFSPPYYLPSLLPCSKWRAFYKPVERWTVSCNKTATGTPLPITLVPERGTPVVGLLPGPEEGEEEEGSEEPDRETLGKHVVPLCLIVALCFTQLLLWVWRA